MKIAIHTEALGSIISGGIRCIIYFLNELKRRNYDVCAFVDFPPFSSTWLKSDFEVFSSNSSEYFDFDGVLISPFSPTINRVSEHKKASSKIYWVHTFEGGWAHVESTWRTRAINSYKLKNVDFMATSHQVSIILESIFQQKVLPYCVPGGIDPKVFFCDSLVEKNKLKTQTVRFCMLDRPEIQRGISVGLQAFELLKKKYGDLVSVELLSNIPQTELHKAYGRNHFFIDPSLLAGLPLPPLEAMACGTIPIVTHFGTNDYIIDGENGFFINANDTKHTQDVLDAATKIVIEHIEDEKTETTTYKKISAAAKTQANKWTWEKMVSLFEKNLEYARIEKHSV